MDGDYLLNNDFQRSPAIIFGKLVAGDTWTFQYLAGQRYGTGYSAAITFAAGTSKLTVPATQDGVWFNWSIPGNQTASLPPQPYGYQVSVTDGSGNRLTVERGAVTVVQDFSIAGAQVKAKSNLQLMLEACDATLIALLGQKSSFVQFAGQSYTMHEIDKLWDVRESLAVRVRDETSRLDGNRRSRRVIVRFVDR